jgi:membrane-associated phospholipid phosphatase
MAAPKGSVTQHNGDRRAIGHPEIHVRMRLTAASLAWVITPVVWGQLPPDGGPRQGGAPQEQIQKPPEQKQESTLEVQPGPPVIKQKDLYDATGYFHPFVRLPKYVLQDQKAIWSSPFHTAKSNVKWWAIFGGATAALIATDQWTVKQLPNSRTQVSISTWGSRLGAGYTLVPFTAGLYFAGSHSENDRLRETGLIGFETLIDVNIIAEALKLVADRARPLEGNGKGRFEDGSGTRWNSSFPSGHAINTWALASVVAHQYPHPRIIPVLVYAAATTVVVARVGARQHFPGDVVAGSAMGWFIGDYVYGKRHNRSLDAKRSAAQKLLDHIRIGAALQ